MKAPLPISVAVPNDPPCVEVGGLCQRSLAECRGGDYDDGDLCPGTEESAGEPVECCVPGRSPLGHFLFFQDLKRIWKSKRLIVSSWSRTVLLRTVHTDTASKCSDEGGTCRYVSTGCPEGDFVSSLCPEQYHEVMCCVPSP